MGLVEGSRVLQVFLSIGLHGVFEVSFVPSTKELSCTCPGFENRGRCKHVSYVKSRSGPDGEYVVALTPDTDVEDLRRACSGDPEDWRQFVYMHTPVEVI